MIDDSDCRRLARYFADECTAEERRETEAWLAHAPQRRAEAEELRALWNASAHPSWTPNADAAWMSVAARVHVGEAQTPLVLVPPTVAPRASSFRWRRAGRSKARVPLLVAASIVAVAAIAFVSESERFRLIDRAESIRAPEPDREFRTARGQRGIVVLGDGSRVELGAESVLRVKAPTASGKRVVVLEGQAVFDVVHDTLRPFEVRSGNAITEDLGTRFTVRAYPGDSRVRVFVASGSVALRAVGAPSSSGTLLGPNDLGTLDSLGRATVRNGVDSTAHLAWTRDRFVFENALLGDVLDDIARWYGVTIEVADPALARRRITMNVPARSITDVLGAVTTPLRLRSAKRGSTIVIE